MTISLESRWGFDGLLPSESELGVLQNVRVVPHQSRSSPRYREGERGTMDSKKAGRSAINIVLSSYVA